ncbi:MAG: hypothetical protein ACI4EA_11660 [Candidatus Ornithomonoglobus sp.]
MKKIKPKKNTKLFGSSNNGTDKDDVISQETIGQNIERRAKLSRLRSQKVKFAIIFLIKTVETFMASIIPSVISVFMIFFNPNEKSWAVMKIVSFVVTACVNWRLWLKYAAMKSGPKEFYLMNGLTYLLYFASSVIGYYTLGYLVYSMTYANLRVFEIFGMKTMESILCSNGIMLLILVCCERFSNIQFKRFLEWTHKNGSDRIEMNDILTDDTPMQQDRVIESLSIEEIANNMIREEQEAIEAKRIALKMMPDSTFDEGTMTKGRGEKVERAEVVDMDNDLTEGDFNASEAAQKEYEQNMQYSGDSLWSSSIYIGRTKDGKPITEYDEEGMHEVLDQMIEDDAAAYDTDDTGSLWDEGIYQGRHVSGGINVMDPDAADTTDDEKINYDADSLWENSFYQGRNKDSVPEKALDFDDAVSEHTMVNAINYDVDDLWDSVSQGRGKNVQRLEDADEEAPVEGANLSADYDTDSLWDNIYQGRKK